MLNVKRLSFWVFVVTAIVVLTILYRCWRTEDDVGFLESVFYGFSVVVGLGIAFVSGDMARKRVSEYHTASTSLSHYLILTSLSIFGWIMRWRLDKEVKNTRAVQEKTLLDMLQLNANTVYGKEYKFAEVRSCADFQKTHPLTKYSHYELYIQRQMQGETHVLTADSPVLFAVTSGTSGKSSVLPMLQRQKAQFFFKGVSVALNAMLNYYPNCNHLQKTLKFFYTPKWRTAPNGVPIGPGSSTPSSVGKLLDMYSTPQAAFDILDEPKALYLYLLFGLRDRDIGMLESNFVSSVYMGFKALDAEWEQLACDIELGKVRPDLNIEPEIRGALNSVLMPDPERAREIREAFQEGSVGVAKRLWPNCNLIVAADTGAFALYGKLLQENHCKGIPIFPCMYAATEGLIGIDIWPEIKPARYLLVPSVMFFEFIPVDRTDEPQPDTLLMHQVELGCEYELVITTVSGLCRYRFGDVVKVVDFYHTCPVIEFMYRQGQLLNVHCEKTSEVTFYKALSRAVSRWQGVTLVDYCCAESILQNDHQSRVSPYYIVFLELEGTDEDISLAEQDFSRIDAELCELSYVYRSYRNKKSIEPMVVHSVIPGTFQRLRDFMLERNIGSSNQYKVPRVAKRPEALQFLMMNRVMSASRTITVTK